MILIFHLKALLVVVVVFGARRTEIQISRLVPYMTCMSRRGKLTRENLFVTIICFNARGQRVCYTSIVFVVFEQFFRIPGPNFKVFQKTDSTIEVWVCLRLRCVW